MEKKETVNAVKEAPAKVKAAVGKAADKAAAKRIETRKNVRATGRKARETVATSVEKTAGDLKDATEKAKLADQMTAGRVKVQKDRKVTEKKTAKKEKAAIRAEDKEEKAAQKRSVKRKTGKMNIVFQSTMGGSVTPEQIALRMPKDTADVYVKLEENKAYYVLKNGETGSVDIW